MPIFYKIFVLVFVLLFSTVNAVAQEVEEVVVQAERSDAVPIEEGVSVAVLDGEKLADAGIENVEDVAAYVPNLVLSETSTGTNIVIRGIGAGVNQGFDQSVGLYIDHVPLPRGQMARAPFLDLGGVQVLRGPQYVRDGNYSIAGSVHMLTREAKDEFELALDFTNVPSQDDKKLLVTMASPITDWWSARLAYQVQQADGYVENVARNEDGPQRDDSLIRLVNTFNITSDFKAKLKVERGNFDRVGRQIEIIDSQETPDFREFPNYRGEDGLQPPRDARAGPAFNNGVLLPEYTSELDYILRPIQSLYDAPYGGVSGSATPAYAGRSYLEVLNDLYLGPLGGEEIDELNGAPFSNGPVTPPAGLLDADVDFRRAANEDEASQNTSTNITLNLEYYLGQNLLRFIASDVDYDYEETIDSDFTPVPILLTEQAETYEQQFFRFDFESSADNALQVRAGASYLDSELTFDEVVRTRVGGPRNQAEVDQFFITGVPDQGVYVTFNPEVTVDQGAPFLPYFGRYVTGLARSLQVFEPNRQFTQDAETIAAFVDLSWDVTERLSLTLGARYTRAKKSAVRDFAFLLKDGTAYVVPETIPGTNFGGLEDNVTSALGTIFNFAEHTDRQVISNRVTQPFNTERCGEVQSFALGGPCDDDALPGGPNAPIDDEQFLPSFTVNYQLTPDLLTFFSFRQANKLGGFDARSNAPPTVLGGRGLAPGTFRFDDEDATTFELGAQWYFPNGTGLLNATLFYTDFKNLQVSTADRSVGFNVRNAGEAISQGIEVEGNYQPLESFGINYSFAWIDFEFQDFPFGACTLYERPDSYLITTEDAALNAVLPLGTVVPIVYERSIVDPNPTGGGTPAVGYGAAFVDAEQVLPLVPDGSPEFFAVQSFDNRSLSVLPTFCDFEGKTNQYVAEYQGTFTFNFRREFSGIGVLKSSLDVLYNSGYETTTTQEAAVAQEEYVQLNGRLALASSEDVWEVALQGENLTNEKIVGFASEVPIGSRLQGARTHFGFVRPPRSLGINFRYKFY